MNYSYYHIVVIFLFILLFSCNNDSEMLDPEVPYDCEFIENEKAKDGILDETERMIFNECRENQLTSNGAIESNLIGEWELIGFVDGWFSDVTQPCGYIIITKDELIFYFENESNNLVSTHQWQIEDLWLKVSPENRNLTMSTFCDQYMYGSHSDFGIFVFDGDEFIYEKVK